MLGQQLESAYKNALSRYQDQLEAYHKSGDVIAFLDSLKFPDEDLQEENKKLAQQQSLSQCSPPFRVSEDYEFNTEGGFWIERKTGLRVRAVCLLPPTKIVSPLFETIGFGHEGQPEFVMVWKCRHCGAEYFYEPPSSGL